MLANISRKHMPTEPRTERFINNFKRKWKLYEYLTINTQAKNLYVRTRSKVDF